MYKKWFKKHSHPSLEIQGQTRLPIKPSTPQRSHKLSSQILIAGMEFPWTRALPTHTNLKYANASPVQTLDLYLPQGGGGPFPLVILIHGGGFGMGDKSQMVSKAGTDILLDNGFAVANVNYRLSLEAKAPAQVHDIKTAVRWLRAHSYKYNMNPEKICAWGSSAGGTLAALLGTSVGDINLEGAHLGCSEESSQVQAVIDWFGPVDFLLMDEQFAGKPVSQTHNEPNSPESLLIGAPLQSRPDLVRVVNPITYISSNASPFLIQHGKEDFLVPPQQSQMLYDALVKALRPEKVSLTFIEGASHGGPQFWTIENVEMVLNFLDRYLLN
jgi:acetyl esterase/lipase